jgi:hypothetical protein
MPHRIRRHLSFANVASLGALVFAMAGTSYAVTVAKNSVGSAQIKKSAVANSDIRANAVTSSKVKNGSLQAVDFAANQLPRGATGPQGAPGTPGTPGTPGANGAPGTVGAATAQFLQAPADLANGANQSYSVFCPAGQQAIAGGGRGDDTLSEETILTNTRPAISSTNTEPPTNGQSFTGWRITVVNPIGGAASGIRPEVWVVCVAAPP